MGDMNCKIGDLIDDNKEEISKEGNIMTKENNIVISSYNLIVNRDYRQ